MRRAHTVLPCTGGCIEVEDHVFNKHFCFCRDLWRDYCTLSLPSRFSFYRCPQDARSRLLSIDIPTGITSGSVVANASRVCTPAVWVRTVSRLLSTRDQAEAATLLRHEPFLGWRTSLSRVSSDRVVLSLVPVLTEDLSCLFSSHCASVLRKSPSCHNFER